MFPSIVLLVSSAIGINYGWEPLPEGGMKYIVQFEPDALVEAQKAGFDLESNIPSNIGDVRVIAFRSGTGPLPQKFPPSAISKDSKAAMPSTVGEPAKPWALIGVSLALFGSLGGNAYLLWIFAELRKRYRALLAK